jgi:hypothetical protein
MWMAVHQTVWGDVPTWVAAVGTSGSLITAMVIIHNNRMDRLRKYVDAFTPNTYLVNNGVVLIIKNVLNRSFFNFEFYGLVEVTLASGEKGYVGVRCSNLQLDDNTTATSPHFWSDCRDFDLQDSVMTYLVTDTAGRTWLHERKKVDRLVPYRRKWLVQRKLARLEQTIGRKAGTTYPRFFTEDFHDAPVVPGGLTDINPDTATR